MRQTLTIGHGGTIGLERHNRPRNVIPEFYTRQRDSRVTQMDIALSHIQIVCSRAHSFLKLSLIMQILKASNNLWL